MQVPLNEPSEYDSGRLIFALPNGSLLWPEREVGSATLHNNGVVHGVTEITRGVRYGLFFLLVPEDY
jgi:predicted 2-oxoglutarate/Fe(II)-dependent dioxygenase YbiX